MWEFRGFAYRWNVLGDGTKMVEGSDNLEIKR